MREGTPVASSHTMTCLSFEPETTTLVPGTTATAPTKCEWPRSVFAHEYAAVSSPRVQMRSEASREAVKTSPREEAATQRTSCS